MPDIALRYQISPQILGAAQRLACQKQQKGMLKPIYFLFLVVLGVIFDMLCPTVYWAYALVACAVAYVSYLLLYARRLRRKISAEWGEISLLVQEDGILITQARRYQTLYFWPILREIRAIPAKRKEDAWISMRLDGTQGMVVPIPFSAFADDAARQAFVDAVKAGIEKAR